MYHMMMHYVHMGCFCVYVMHRIYTCVNLFFDMMDNHLAESYEPAKEVTCQKKREGYIGKGEEWKTFTENCDMVCRNMYIISFHSEKKKRLKRLMIMCVCDQSESENMLESVAIVKKRGIRGGDGS